MPTTPATARMPATVRMQATTVKQATAGTKQQQDRQHSMDAIKSSRRLPDSPMRGVVIVCT
jgi:hypothetical protein